MGYHQERQAKGEERTLSQQVPAAVKLVAISKQRKNSPQRTERQDESRDAQHILVGRHTNIHLRPDEGVISATQIAEVLDHKQ